MMSTLNSIQLSAWGGDLTADGKTRWNPADGEILLPVTQGDWRAYRSLRLLLETPRRTAARIQLEALGAAGDVLGNVLFAVDWKGENDMRLWLSSFEPLQESNERWQAVRSLRLRQEQPGIFPTTLLLGAVEVSQELPVWKVNESDTVIEMGYHYQMVRGLEWNFLTERSFTPGGEPYRLSTQHMFVINRQEVPKYIPGDRPGGGYVGTLHLGYPQGNRPGRLCVERRFDLDIRDQRQILAKLVWDKDCLLTCAAVVDGGKEIFLAKDRAPAGDMEVIGADLQGAARLEAVRITVEEREQRSYEKRDIELGIFWMLLRAPCDVLDSMPVNEIQFLPASRYNLAEHQGETIPVKIQEEPFVELPESKTPIGDPLKDGLPFGFYVRRGDLPDLRQRALEGIAKPIFDNLHKIADHMISHERVDWTGRDQPVGGGVGQLYGVRAAGMTFAAPLAAITHLITGEEKYALAARRWVLRATASDDWRAGQHNSVGRPQIGEIFTYMDSFTDWYPLGFGGYMNHPFHQAYSALGILAAYDMLYHCFSPQERQMVEDAFIENGIYIILDKIYTNRAYYVSMNQGALFASPLLMQLAFLRKRGEPYESLYHWTIAFLKEFGQRPWNEEGIFSEGPGYGNYTLHLYMMALIAMSACEGVPIAQAAPASMLTVMEYCQQVRSTWEVRSPQGELVCPLQHFLSLSDGSQGSWLSGDVLAFYAGILKHPVGQFFWEEKYAADPPKDLFTFLFLREGTPAQPPDLPPVKIYPSQVQAFLRTGWQPGDSLVMLNNLRHVTGHGHHDRGSVIFEYNREALLLDPGMITYSDPASSQYTRTFCHNTLTFSQGNQPGGVYPYDTSFVDVLSTSGETCPGNPGGIDWVIADVSALYPEAELFNRHLIFLRPDVVILYDRVIAHKAEAMELNFTCLGPISQKTCPDGSSLFLSTTRLNRLLLHTQATTPLSHQTANWGTYWKEVPSYRLIRPLAEPARTCNFLTVLAAHDLQAEMPAIVPAGINGWLGVSVRRGEGEEAIYFRQAGGSNVLPGGIETDASAVILRQLAGRLSGAALWDGSYVRLDGKPVLEPAEKKGLFGLTF